MEAHSRIEKEGQARKWFHWKRLGSEIYRANMRKAKPNSLKSRTFYPRARVNFYEGAYSELPMEGEVELKEWECVEVKHHKDVARTVEQWQKNGWRLHTYQATGRDVLITHYLLFQKGE